MRRLVRVEGGLAVSVEPFEQPVCRRARLAETGKEGVALDSSSEFRDSFPNLLLAGDYGFSLTRFHGWLLSSIF